jgi:hypothetical protein
VDDVDDDEIQGVDMDDEDDVVDTVVDGVVLVLVAVEGIEDVVEMDVVEMDAVEMDDEDAAADEDKDSADPDYSYY